MKELTVYELMGEDCGIVAEIKNGDINVKIFDENSNVVFDETSHRYAWESLVSFAKMILEQDKKVQKQLVEKP